MSVYSNYRFSKEGIRWRSRISDAFKKDLLKNSTEAEAIFYPLLKTSLKGVSKVQRQKRFFTPKSFVIADFYLRAKRIVIEIDGSVHQTKKQKEIDRLKDEIYSLRNCDVIRIKNEDVIPNPQIALTKIMDLVRGKKRTPELRGTALGNRNTSGIQKKGVSMVTHGSLD